ncbi:MAG: hypothetical protein HY819_08375 [Acidobacteria bacterium]|nr:hypothetical protein [Acidobacteriota bacterium]
MQKKYSSIITLTITLCLLLSSLFVVNNAEAAQQKRRRGKAAAAKTSDPRKLTRIQTTTIDVGSTKKAVEVLYLNSPWGATTFGYLEEGGNDYYSNRTWPFAHLKVNAKAKYEGKAIEPGDYILYITPKNNNNKQMSMSLASFKPEAGQKTFLVNGDVFTETPENINVITTRPVNFAKGAEVAKALKIALTANGSDVNINMHYGDRTLTEKVTIN